MENRTNNLSILLAAATLCLGFAGNVMADEYDGSWVLKDSQGKPFQANLNLDGTATGTHNDSMKQGTWKVEDGAAVIHWNTGWTTRISKKDHKYVKAAYKPGASLSDEPTNTSDAKKIK